MSAPAVVALSFSLSEAFVLFSSASEGLAVLQNGLSLNNPVNPRCAAVDQVGLRGDIDALECALRKLGVALLSAVPGSEGVS